MYGLPIYVGFLLCMVLASSSTGDNGFRVKRTTYNDGNSYNYYPNPPVTIYPTPTRRPVVCNSCQTYPPYGTNTPVYYPPVTNPTKYIPPTNTRTPTRDVYYYNNNQQYPTTQDPSIYGIPDTYPSDTYGTRLQYRRAARSVHELLDDKKQLALTVKEKSNLKRALLSCLGQVIHIVFREIAEAGENVDFEVVRKRAEERLRREPCRFPEPN